MSLLDKFISTIVPHTCLGCSIEGRLLCPLCCQRLTSSIPCCYRCRSPSASSFTCDECLAGSYLRQVIAATVYEELAKDLVWKLKSGHAQAAAREMAILMSPLVDQLLISSSRGRNLLIVPVPTATTRMRQRGYDQARLLAREVAIILHQPYADLLARHNQAHQVGASRQQRQQQLAEAFRVTKPRLAREADILLIDDVVTTGATLEAAAGVLRTAGAERITALVFAQPKLRQLGAIR